jgi:hypothetical protein
VSEGTYENPSMRNSRTLYCGGKKALRRVLGMLYDTMELSKEMNTRLRLTSVVNTSIVSDKHVSPHVCF